MPTRDTVEANPLRRWGKTRRIEKTLSKIAMQSGEYLRVCPSASGTTSYAHLPAPGREGIISGGCTQPPPEATGFRSVESIHATVGRGHILGDKSCRPFNDAFLYGGYH